MKQRLSAKVANAKDSRTETDRFARNPNSRDNVNVEQGPRTGNAGAHEGKRGAFKAAKAEREPLAAAVMKAFADRQLNDYEEHDFPNDGSIDENSHVKKFKTSRTGRK
jgi:hypothetical protein